MAKKNPVVNNPVANAAPVAPQGTQTPPIETTIIIASGKLKGEKKTIAQDLSVRHRKGQPLGEIVYGAITIYRQLGGLLEDTDNNGTTFYPTECFEHGIKFAPKVVFQGDISK